MVQISKPSNPRNRKPKIFSILILILAVFAVPIFIDLCQVISKDKPGFTHDYPINPFQAPTTNLSVTSSPAIKTPTITNNSVSPLPEWIASLYFIDLRHGWLLGERLVNPLPPGDPASLDIGSLPKALALASTQDGGKTWQPLVLPGTDLSFDYQTPSGVYFIDQSRGWFFYRNLFSTLDGGKTWKDEHFQGTILRMERAPDRMSYAIVRSSKGLDVIEVLPTSSGSWQKWASNFPENSNPDTLVLANSKEAWVSGWIEEAAGRNLHLFRTQDRGLSWQELAHPCESYSDKSWIGVIDSNHLWVACGRAGAGTWGGKSVHFSADGGDTWELRGIANLPPDSKSTMSSFGYLTGMQALSLSDVYLPLGRSSALQLTHDGGKTWGSATIYPVSPEFAKIFFLDPQIGWAYYQMYVYRTLDGGIHWECTELPQNKDCS